MSASVKTHAFSVSCPLRGGQEQVFVRTLDLGSTHAAQFCGCDGSFHNCPECRACEGVTLGRFSASHGEPPYTLLPSL